MVPMTVQRFVNEAWRHGADAITLDLEDGVPRMQKGAARAGVKEAISQASRGGAEVFVRVNKAYLYADIEAAVWPDLTGIMLSKVESAAEVSEAASLLDALERQRGLEMGSLQLIVLLESALGVWNSRDIVSAINRHGPLAVGVSGEDAGLIRAGARHPDLGFVGDVEAVNPSILERLLAEELIPVVSTIGSDASGQAYNINADAVAAAIAEALGAEKLVYLTDVEVLRGDLDDPTTLIHQTTADELERLIAEDVISGGMIPKAASCVHAVRHGVHRAHILDGRVPHVLLLEIFTDEGIGTVIDGGADD